MQLNLNNLPTTARYENVFFFPLFKMCLLYWQNLFLVELISRSRVLNILFLKKSLNNWGSLGADQLGIIFFIEYVPFLSESSICHFAQKKLKVF